MRRAEMIDGRREMRRKGKIESGAEERLKRRTRTIKGKIDEIRAIKELRFPVMKLIEEERRLKPEMLPGSEVGILEEEFGKR